MVPVESTNGMQQVDFNSVYLFLYMREVLLDIVVSSTLVIHFDE